MQSTHEPAHEASHHIVEPIVYLKTFGLLILLMIATVVVYYIHLPYHWMSNLVAMTIAVTKATLVVLFFMQVKYSSRLTWLWAGIGFLWLAIMFTIVTDYITRDWIRIVGW